jgi:hypothetical protein
MTKGDAEKEIRKRILQLITSLVKAPSNYSVVPFHCSHRVTLLMLNLGLTDYWKAGTWYQVVSYCLFPLCRTGAHVGGKCVGSGRSECTRAMSVIQEAPDNLVMTTPALFRLFLLFEEVQPCTEAANRGRVRIHTAPGYQVLWEEYYVDEAIPPLDEENNRSLSLEAGPSGQGGDSDSEQ